jgi:serine/threonine protein kinase
VLAEGTRLGPYEILAPLGAGGMGEVYRVRDPRLSREVAIKLVSTDGAPSPHRLRRLEIEARAAAQLSHPYVVTVFEVGTHDGHPYLVLELLEGETLREALRGGIPPLRQAVAWALEVSRGLAAAHERGIVHRDLKPENVFLTTDGGVKILDFGLAKLREALVSDEADRESPTATRDTAPGVLLGTVGYMSPEQMKGTHPGPPHRRLRPGSGAVRDDVGPAGLRRRHRPRGPGRHPAGRAPDARVAPARGPRPG